MEKGVGRQVAELHDGARGPAQPEVRAGGCVDADEQPRVAVGEVGPAGRGLSPQPQASRLDVEPLLTYRINPFTVFYAGSAARYRRYEAEEFDDLTASEWRNSERQFFAKLQYLFRL